MSIKNSVSAIFCAAFTQLPVAASLAPLGSVPPLSPNVQNYRPTKAAEASFSASLLDFTRNSSHAQLPGRLIIATSEDCHKLEREGSSEITQLFTEEAASNPVYTAWLQCLTHSMIGSFQRQIITNHGGSLNFVMVRQLPNSKPENYFATLARIPVTAVTEKIPGSAKDWEVMYLFHELGHASRGHSQVDIDRRISEHQADTTAIKLYHDAFRLKLVSNPDVPNAFIAARALSAMLRPSPHATEHDPAALRPTKHFSVLQGKHNLINETRRMAEARAEVFKVTLEQQNPAQYQNLRLLAHGEVLKSLNPDSGVPPGNHAAQLDRLLLAHISSPTEMPKYAPYMLIAAEKVLASNALKDNPTGQAFLEAFTKAALTYAPGYFKTSTSPAQLRNNRVALP